MSLLFVISREGGAMVAEVSADAPGSLPAARSGQAAYIAGEGDSIAQTTPHQDPAFGYIANMARVLGRTYYANGVGGTQTDSILGRVTSVVVPKNLSIAVVEGGVNDEYYRGTGTSSVADVAASIANLKSIVNAYASNGVPIIIHCLITPWTNGDNTQNTNVDAINSAMVAWMASTYPQHIVFDTRALLGQFRAGGATGNKWDIKPEYICDSDGLGVHFNDLAYQVWGEAMAEAVYEKRGFSKPSAPTGVTFDDTANTVSWTSTGSHEVTINGGLTYTTATSPYSVPDIFRGINRVGVRKVGSPRPSDTVFNTAAFTKPASANDIDLSTNTNIQVSGRVFTTNGSGWGNSGLSSKKLASGQDGSIGIKYASPLCANYVFGFKTANSQGGYATIEAGFRTYTDGRVEKVESGTFTFISGLFLPLDADLRIFRTGSTLTLKYSTNEGSTWTTIGTYALSTSAELSIGADLYGNVGRIDYPTGSNLS